MGLGKKPVAFGHLDYALQAIVCRAIDIAMDDKRWLQVFQSLQESLEIVDFTCTPADLQADFKKAFAGWKLLRKEANLLDLLNKAKCTDPSPEIFGVYRVLNQKAAQFEDWKEDVEYIGGIVDASDDDIQCYLNSECSLVFRFGECEFTCKDHDHSNGGTSGQPSIDGLGSGMTAVVII